MFTNLVSESLSDILKPKAGALDKLEKWKFKNLMRPPENEEALDDWLKLNKNLAIELDYKGIKDAKNIFTFDYDYELENFPGSFNLFVEIAAPDLELINVVKTEFSGGLKLYIGLIDDGSKVIYYIGGMISGYIARKEWLK